MSDVLIVGLGPTGAVLAHLLALSGVTVQVVERHGDIHPLPRAVHFDDEVMRIFQTIGVAKDVAAVSRTNPGMRFVDRDGAILLDWPRPQVAGPHGWHPSWRFHQPDLERILRAALDQRPQVRVLTGTVTGFSKAPDGVTTTIETPQGSVAHTASWVVGCDGGRSMTRAAIGTNSADLGFHERWLVVDVILSRDRPDLGDHTVQHCNPDQPATYVRGPGNRRRWEIALLDRDVDPTDPDQVWPYISSWITPADARIERAAVYTFHATIAHQWRRDRLLIAGDAAHQTPPFMGQGMCAGLRDAANLAWKLARCVQGHDPALLDSYGPERTTNVRRFIETAVRLGRLVNASGTVADLESAFRQADGTVRMQSILPALGPGLAHPDDALGGHLFAQPTVEGTPLDDRIGYRMALLHRPGRDVSEPGLACVPVPDLPESIDALLLRPDRYILGTATAPDVPDLLERHRPLWSATH